MFVRAATCNAVCVTVAVHAVLLACESLEVERHRRYFRPTLSLVPTRRLRSRVGRASRRRNVVSSGRSKQEPGNLRQRRKERHVKFVTQVENCDDCSKTNDRSPP
jgi:hypothetical protein